MPALHPSPAVITYRRYRNTDPPALVDVWNESLTGRGSYPIRTPGMLERWVFSKTYFTPDDVMVAWDDEAKTVAGFALVGFAPTEDLSALDTTRGVICAVLVRPGYRRRGIGRELARQADANLRKRGATGVVFGSAWPACPYLFGIYGGSNSPGVLASESDADGFLKALGYTPVPSKLVFQKSLEAPLTVADPRFNLLRRRYDMQALRTAAVGSWWQDCVWGTLEPVELRMVDKLTGLPAARALLWELEGFSWKWNSPSAGVIDVQVRPDLRRQGLAKLLLSQVLRFLQEQFFTTAELHVPANDPAAVGLCQSLGLEQMDQGCVYSRGDPPAEPQAEG